MTISECAAIRSTSFGVNFGLPPIPIPFVMRLGYNKRFEGKTYHLVGLTDSPVRRDSMVIQASNGHRMIQTFERTIGGKTCYAIYCR